MRRLVTLTLVPLALLTVAVPVGIGSDRSVKRAWDSDDAKFVKHGERVGAAYRRWERSGFRKKRALLQELAATRRTLDGTRARVRAEQASSGAGRKARYWALRSMRAFDRELAAIHSAVRARSAGRRTRARRLFAAADEHHARTMRFVRRAKRLFRRAFR